MARRKATCNPGWLDLLLRDRLPEDSRRDLEAHLLACPACRTKLDELAGGARWWTEIRQYLGGDGAMELARTADGLAPRRAIGAELDFLDTSENAVSLGRLGPYEVLDVLGRGGWGIVLKAFDPALHRPVAIKVLAAEYAANGTARKRFAREAQAAAAVVHDHVVPVHAVDADATPPYLVMAFIPGQSLQQRIDRSGPLEVREVLRIGMQTASGLAAAHAQGLVHRDIKPANIMLENGVERVRITDFGLARAVDDASVTHAGSVAGTPQYMAPEQARGEQVDQRADLFALGSTLYAMCTGKAPFRGDSGVAVIRQVCDCEPVPIRSRNPDVPIWLEGIIRKLHAKDPDERFQSAAEVAALLEGCLAHVQQPDRQVLPRRAEELGRQVPGPGPAKRRGWQRAAAVAAIVLVGGGLLYFPRPGPGPEVAVERATAPEPNPAPRRHARAASMDAAMDAFDRDVQQLTGRIEAMTVTSSEESVRSPVDELRRQAEHLREQLTTGTEAVDDPIEAGLRSVRNGLERLRQQKALSN
jgi:serine/threonine-protein kinase